MKTSAVLLDKLIIRVYGFLLNSYGEVLVSDEYHYGMHMRKFPGGGHQLGEGTVDTLIRELREEMNVGLQPLDLVHTTATFIQSAFNPSHQVMGVYYHVPVTDVELLNCFRDEAVTARVEGDVFFRWEKLGAIEISSLTFPMDQEALEVFRKKFEAGRFS
jgi:8-oxo-dGTP pyrophosphatase MutT (NUDIX family)